MMKEKIYTILVAYNPDIEHLKKSITLLLQQTDKVIICNNSETNINLGSENIVTFNFNENLGIAKAQNIGMEWAFSKWCRLYFTT